MLVNLKKRFILILSLVSLAGISFAQNFITGADLSYVNKILEKGGEYRNEEGQIIDPYVYFGEQGAKMIRLRLWHTPENILDACDDPITSSSLIDVMMAAKKIHDNGMGLNLSIHYGDYFNDPGKQLRPDAWAGLSHQLLLDSIYQYTYHVLEQLYEQNTTPHIVSIGNETTNGFIDESIPTNGFSWPDDADKFNAGLAAVDDFNVAYAQSVSKAIHFTENTAKWATGEFISHGVSNFDIIGISFYPLFSPGKNLESIGTLIHDLIDDYEKEVMLFETGFIWTTENADNYGNFIGNNGNTLEYPISAAGQKDYLFDLSKVVLDHGGTGLFYWEPAWVSSEMCDRWGQGSSYENAGFFDFNSQNMPLPAFEFFKFEDTLAISQIDLQAHPIIFPNPLSNQTSFRFELTEDEDINLTIYNALGKQIKMLSQACSKGPQQIILDTGDFETGLYFYRLQLGKFTYEGKLLKMGE